MSLMRFFTIVSFSMSLLIPAQMVWADSTDSLPSLLDGSSDAIPFASPDTIVEELTIKQRASSTSGTRGLWTLEGGHPMDTNEVTISLAARYAQHKPLLSDTDFNSYGAGALSIAYAPLNYFEMSLQFNIINDFNTEARPQNYTIIGDPTFKFKLPLSLLYNVGLAFVAGVRIPSGIDNKILDFTALSADLRVALSVDIKRSFHLHLNAGGYFDASHKVMSAATALSEKFAGGYGEGIAIVFGLGSSYDFKLSADHSIEPFFVIQGMFTTDQEDINYNMLWSTVGAIWKNGAFELSAGIDIRILGEPHLQNPLTGLQPFLVGLQAHYHFGTARTGLKDKVVEKIVTKEVEKIVYKERPRENTEPLIKEVQAKTWKIAGRLLDARTNKPISEGSIKVRGSRISALTVNSDDGSFQTYPLQADRPVVLEVLAPGFIKRDFPVAPRNEGIETIVIALQPAQDAVGTLKGSIKNRRGKPLRARVFIPSLRKTILTKKKNGTFKAEIPAGTYEVVITAKKHRMQKKKIEIRPGDVLILNIDLRRRRR